MSLGFPLVILTWPALTCPTPSRPWPRICPRPASATGPSPGPTCPGRPPPLMRPFLSELGENWAFLSHSFMLLSFIFCLLFLEKYQIRNFIFFILSFIFYSWRNFKSERFNFVLFLSKFEIHNFLSQLSSKFLEKFQILLSNLLFLSKFEIVHNFLSQLSSKFQIQKIQFTFPIKV